MPKNIPYRVRVQILRYMDDKGYCGYPIHEGILIELIQKYSPGYYQDSSFGDQEATHFDNVFRGEYVKFGWDGKLIDRLWEEVVKCLDSDFIHDFS